MRHLYRSLALAVPIILSACGSSHPSNPSPAPSARGQLAATSPVGQAPASASAEQAGHFHAVLALVGQPSVTADGKAIEITVDLTNDGSEAFGSASRPHPVNLGAHSIDESGKIVNNDLSRALLPQIKAGASQRVTILLPIDKVRGYRAQILPVEEGIGWFSDWGTEPLDVGPFKTCAETSAGAVCDASGKPLPAATVSG